MVYVGENHATLTDGNMPQVKECTRQVLHKLDHKKLRANWDLLLPNNVDLFSPRESSCVYCSVGTLPNSFPWSCLGYEFRSIAESNC